MLRDLNLKTCYVLYKTNISVEGNTFLKLKTRRDLNLKGMLQNNVVIGR